MNLGDLTYYIAPLIGLSTLAIGISAVLHPLPMAKKFGVPANESAAPYVVSTGIRDVFIGLAVLVLFYSKAWFALGAINLCLGIVAISDFIVVFRHGDRKTSYVHLAGAVFVVTYGLWLLALMSWT